MLFRSVYFCCIPKLILNSSINIFKLIELPSKPSKTPKLHERHLYEFIKKQIDLVSYHKVQKSLEGTMSSGAFQGAVKRCLLPGADFRIYEGKKISEKKDRLIRLFSVEPSKVASLNLPDLSKIVGVYENIIDGKVFELDNSFILPFKLDRKDTQILKELVKIGPNFESIGNLFSEALDKYLEESVSDSLIKQAKQKVEENQN